jgi:hypothetical protein
MRLATTLLSTFLALGCSSRSEPPKTQAEAPRVESAESAHRPETAVSPAANAPSNRLTAEDVARTISEVAPRVKAECWQPALDTRRSEDPTGVRIMMRVVVSPSGSVDSVRPENAPEAYPSLPSCIEKILRNTKFPRAAQSTSLSIPFVFAAK